MGKEHRIPLLRIKVYDGYVWQKGLTVESIQNKSLLRSPKGYNLQSSLERWPKGVMAALKGGLMLEIGQLLRETDDDRS